MKRLYIRVARKVGPWITRNRVRVDGTLCAPFSVKAHVQPACLIPCRRTTMFCPTCSSWPKRFRKYCSGCGGREKVPYGSEHDR